MTTATATLHELQHDFAAVEKAAKRSPVKITRKGNVIGTYIAKNNENKADYWQRLRALRARMSGRGITSGEIMSWVLQGRKH